jgi:hypothetical protein
VKIILHMGQGKTGTTALQRALHRHASVLKSHGILYPAFSDRAVAHHLLLALCEVPEHVAGHVSAAYGGYDQARQAATQIWDRLRDEVFTQKPEVLVLSSETFIFGARTAGKHQLAALLKTLSPKIEPVIYLREPVGLYLSRLQQKMRYAARPLPVEVQSFRGAISDTASAFGCDPHLVAYDRQSLRDGDITQDFCSRFLSDWINPALVVGIRANETISAEAMLAISTLRGIIAPDQDWEPHPLADQVLVHLHAISKSARPTRPQLQPHVAAVLRRAATEYLWLRDAHGITFTDLDYAAIDGTPVPAHIRDLPLSGILQVDQASYAGLLVQLLALALGHKSA